MKPPCENKVATQVSRAQADHHTEQYMQTKLLARPAIHVLASAACCRGLDGTEFGGIIIYRLALRSVEALQMQTEGSSSGLMYVQKGVTARVGWATDLDTS